jgi:hypothetical protein
MQGVSSTTVCARRHRSKKPRVHGKISFLQAFFVERGLMMILWVFGCRPEPDGD